MIKETKEITIEYVREKYKDRYKHLSDEQLQQRIDLFKQIAYIFISNFRERKLKSQFEVKSKNDK